MRAKAEQKALSHKLRSEGATWAQVVAEFQTRWTLNARQTIRIARGMSQQDVANEWCRRWPDDSKTFKNISTWERWPEAGHMPSLVVLDRLAQMTLLGRPAEALAIYGETPPHRASGRDKTNFTLLKAQALAHAGELSEGVRLAIVGLDEARAFGSLRFVSRVQRFYERLREEHSPRERHVAALHDALAAK